MYGESFWSETVSILAAQIPDQPETPTTTFVDSYYFTPNPNVVVDWIAPDARGSPITGYRIYFMNYDNTTYSYEIDDCNGANPTIMANT
jgi:hypothetical protein